MEAKNRIGTTERLNQIEFVKEGLPHAEDGVDSSTFSMEARAKDPEFICDKSSSRGIL